MKKQKFSFTAIVWKEAKYYVAQCLNVDVSSFGVTRAEALKNLEEAVELYIEDAPKGCFSEVKSPVLVVRELQYA